MLLLLLLLLAGALQASSCCVSWQSAVCVLLFRHCWPLQVELRV
jgi:hypothetical protein